ncbi:MAG: hypothetical protein J0L99_19485 [Chitinophagales bacterium]|nr:hypothetical protein [Chitinophagales bacterium]
MNMTSLFRKSALTLIYISGIAGALTAQRPGSHTDEKFANTTVVYRDTISTDMEMLKRLDSAFSMGDVVRFDEPPPRPAVSATLPAKLSAAKSSAPVLLAAENLETTLKTLTPVVGAGMIHTGGHPRLELEGDRAATLAPEAPAPLVAPVPAPAAKKAAPAKVTAKTGKKQFYKHADKSRGLHINKLFQGKKGKRVKCYKF